MLLPHFDKGKISTIKNLTRLTFRQPSIHVQYCDRDSQYFTIDIKKCNRKMRCKTVTILLRNRDRGHFVMSITRNHESHYVTALDNPHVSTVSPWSQLHNMSVCLSVCIPNIRTVAWFQRHRVFKIKPLPLCPRRAWQRTGSISHWRPADVAISSTSFEGDNENGAIFLWSSMFYQMFSINRLTTRHEAVSEGQVT